MTEPDLSHLADQHSLLGDPIPAIVLDYAGDAEPELVWRNELGGLTFRIDDRFIKWNPIATGVDLGRERDRLLWLDGRHPAPKVLEYDANETAQWLVMAALPGEHAVGDRWRARRSEAIAAIATGLRAIHTVPIDTFPGAWVDESWVEVRLDSVGERPPVDGPVLVHGDACAPNTLIDLEGRWTGNVDFGDLTVGDRWADLAIASLSLDWNFGEGHQDELFEAYGIEPDTERIRYYRDLWHVAS